MDHIQFTVNLLCAEVNSYLTGALSQPGLGYCRNKYFIYEFSPAPAVSRMASSAQDKPSESAASSLTSVAPRYGEKKIYTSHSQTHPATLQSTVVVHKESSDSSEPTSPLASNPNPPVYTTRLIRKIAIPADEVDENFDENEWYRKVYGPDIIVITHKGVPNGWVLVDGNSLPL